MNCVFQKDKFGRILSVKTENGQDSELFKAAASQPFNDMDMAANQVVLSMKWANELSTSPENRYPTGEPKLYFLTPVGGSTTSYKKALENSGGGTLIYAFKTKDGGFKAVLNISSALNNDSPIGIINNAILNNQLKEEKVFDGQGYSLQGKGSSPMESDVNATNVITELNTLPNNNYKIYNDGLIREPYEQLQLPEIPQEEVSNNLTEVLKGNLTSSSAILDLNKFSEEYQQELQDIKSKTIADGTFMKAPNGKETRLNETEWLTTRHPNFIRWFGDYINNPENASKAVDENGDPIIVYHGSDNLGFTEFSITDVKDGGHFFSSDPGIAKSYTRNNDYRNFELSYSVEDAIHFLKASDYWVNKIFMVVGSDVRYHSLDLVKKNNEGIDEEDIVEEWVVTDSDGYENELLTDRALIEYANSQEIKTPGYSGFFLNLRDPYIIDGYGDNWDDIKGVKAVDLNLYLEYDSENDEYLFIDYNEEVESFPTLIEAYQHIEQMHGENVAEQLKESYEEDQAYGGNGRGNFMYQGDPNTGEEAPYGQSTREWVREAKDYEADGVIFKDIDDNGPHGYSGAGDVYVVFDANNIKSLDNIGQFSSEQDDIRFSKKNDVETKNKDEILEQQILEFQNSGTLVPSIGKLTRDDAFFDIEKLQQRPEVIVPVKEVNIKDLDGVPGVYAISDELRVGDVKNPQTGNVIDNLQGGFGFNLIDGNIYLHWANVEEWRAKDLLKLGISIYELNKELFEKLWESKKLPDGHIPVYVVRMSESAIDSNEAVLRLVADTISNFKPFHATKNQKPILNSFYSSLQKLEDKAKEVLDKTPPKLKSGKDNSAYKKALKEYSVFLSLKEHLKEASFTTITDAIESFIGNEIGHKDRFSLDEKKIIIKILSTSTSDFILELKKLGFKGNVTIKGSREVLKEPALTGDSGTRELTAVTLLDVKNFEGDGIIKTKHPNYPVGLKGMSLGYLKNPIDVGDIFTSMRGSVLRQLMAKVYNNTPLGNIVAWGIPTGMGLSNKQFQGDAPNFNMDNVDLFAGYLRKAFPGVNFIMTQEGFDIAVNRPNVKKFIGKDDVVEGFTDGKTIYINPKLKSNKVLLHESTHIWADFMKSHNKSSKKLWERGVELVKGTEEYKEAVKRYGETELAAEEAIAVLVGNKGATIMDKLKRSKFEQWLFDISEFLKQFFVSSKTLSKKPIDKITLDEFIGAVIYDLVVTETNQSKPPTFLNDKNGAFAPKYSLTQNPFEAPQNHPDPKKVGIKYVKIGNTEISYRDSDSFMTLELIETKGDRRSGEASRALQQFVDYADAHGKTIDLFADSRDRKMTNEQLINFYQKFGFVQKYGGIPEEMIRKPKKQVRFSMSESSYSSQEIDRIKSLPLTIEDGATLNLDGSQYTDGGLVLPIVSINLTQDTLTQEALDKFIQDNSDKIVGNSFKVGLYKFPENNTVSIDLNIIAPRHMREEAIKVGKELGQESLFDLDTFENIKTGADGLNTKDLTVEEIRELAERFSTLENRSAKTQKFFTSASKGEHAPLKPWIPEIPFSNKELKFKNNFFDKHMGNFDTHIATNIPTYRENQVKVASTLVDMYSNITTPKVVNSELEDIKNEYINNNKVTPNKFKITKINDSLFKEISNYHSNVRDDRENNIMKESYRAFLNETKKQYELLVSKGYDIRPWLKEGEPYGVESENVRKDIKNNKRLFYLRSRSATGENNENESSENYMPFEDTGIRIDGDIVLFNDLFRAVHDIFGHGMVNNSFSAQGELNAYKTHAPMYSEKAQKALFLETVVYNAYYKENKSYGPRKIYDIPDKFISKINEPDEVLIYDLGGSEGGFVKSITDASKGSIKTINLDPNKQMQETHNSTPVEGSVFIREAFYEGFTDDDGTIYKKHTPNKKADVVHEAMTFQFINEKRDHFIKEVKDNYMKEDGIFLLEEKITPESEEQWLRNEDIKDNFKLQYYSQEYIDKKKEEVLTGMKKNQTPYKVLLSNLKDEFLFVEEYWDSGNFKGVIASNSKEKIDSFMNSLGGKIISKYNEDYNMNPDKPLFINNIISDLSKNGDINLSCGI